MNGTLNLDQRLAAQYQEVGRLRALSKQVVRDLEKAEQAVEATLALIEDVERARRDAAERARLQSALSATKAAEERLAAFVEQKAQPPEDPPG